MNTEDTPLLPHGGYRKLRSYKVAEAVYDATVVFCRRFYRKDWRMTDQMVQAARSGVRNISEASGAAATSRKNGNEAHQCGPRQPERRAIARLRELSAAERFAGVAEGLAGSAGDAPAVGGRPRREPAPVAGGGRPPERARRAGRVRGKGPARTGRQRHALRSTPGGLSLETPDREPRTHVYAGGRIHGEPLPAADRGETPGEKVGRVGQVGQVRQV